MINFKRLAVLGGGNMGEALVAGLIRSQAWRPSQITVVDVRRDTLERLRRKYRIIATTDSQAAIRGAGIILLAVKPQQMRELLQSIGSWVTRQQLLVSIAAGIRTSVLEQYLVPGVPTIRVMPNTPALVGQGASAMARGRSARTKHEQIARAIFETAGLVVAVPEKLMDAVTAVSGSGPAYVFYLAEAMKQAGTELGLPAAVADALVRQTIKGAGLLLSQSTDDPRRLRERVTSPGGTTEAALKVMEKSRLKSIYSKALRCARNRSIELSQ